MKIYVSHSRNFDFTKALYEPLKISPLAKLHEFIFPHENNDAIYNSKELFASKKCDLIIAEVSFPSTGQGIELGWADIYGIPIICIYKENAQMSHALSLVSKKLLMYTSSDNMIEDLTGALKYYE